MPELPEAAFLRSIELLVSQDRDWVPAAEGHSLYLRPFMIATQRGLGVNRPSSVLPVHGDRVPGRGLLQGRDPAGLGLAVRRSTPAPRRAAPARPSAAATTRPRSPARSRPSQSGCDQVVWLDAVEHRWVEEMGGMNLFFVYGTGPHARIMTPALTGTLLPGITRDSLLTLGPDLGIPAEEGRISADQWRGGCASGELTEVFACGTAAVITPVGKVKSANGEWMIGDGTPGPVTMRLREELVGIQYGQRPDPHGWVHKIC